MSKWESIATLLLERCKQPSFVIDRTGTVWAVNTQFEQLIGLVRDDIVGSSLGEISDGNAWSSRGKTMLRGVFDEAVPQMTLRISTDAIHQHNLVCECVVLGDNDKRVALVTVAGVVRDAPTCLPQFSGDLYYEISLSPEEIGKVLVVWSVHAEDVKAVGKLCHDAFWGRAEPCRDCPAFVGEDANGAHTAVVVGNMTDAGQFLLVRAEFGLQEVVRISRRCVGEEEIRSLARARLSVIAENENLSHRETRVLQLIVEGANTDVIAETLEISPRTVKFHQSNILHKLKVESKLDILRLVF